MEKQLSGLASVRALSAGQAARARCLERVWRDCYPGLFVFVRAFDRRLACDAEDLVQEIMEKVYKKIDAYNPLYRFSTWVFAIARNHCLDRIRREGSRPSAAPGTEAADSPEPVDVMTPERIALGKDEQERVAAFIRAADPDTRQLAFLRFHQGLGYREISRVMCVPAGTLKYRVHELRERLRAHLEDGREK